MEKNLSKKYNSVTADAGYESEENYMHLESNNQEAYIKPATYEKSKTKKFKSDISKRENMIFNVEDNYYICSAGKRLFYKGEQKKKVPLDMNLVRVFMNVKIVLNVNISLDALEPKEISNYMWLETL